MTGMAMGKAVGVATGTRIGIVGVGVTGTATAGRLMATGHALIARDRDRARLDALAPKGARLAEDAAALAAGADVAIRGCNTAAVVGDVGALATMAARLKAEAGADRVGAPLSGDVPAAAEGRLTLMIGDGDSAASMKQFDVGAPA